MIRLVITASLFLLGFFHQAALAQQETGITGSKVAEDALYSWDFGKIKAGQVLSHEFILNNDSVRTLNIKDVTSSCGCTISKAKQRSVPPGKSTAIDVKFDSEGYSGAVEQYIYVHTDSLDKPILKFIIKAYVIN